MPRGVYPRRPKPVQADTAVKPKPRQGLTRTQQAVIHLERAWRLALADIRKGADLTERDLEIKYALVLLTTREK